MYNKSLSCHSCHNLANLALRRYRGTNVQLKRCFSTKTTSDKPCDKHNEFSRAVYLKVGFSRIDFQVTSSAVLTVPTFLVRMSMKLVAVGRSGKREQCFDFNGIRWFAKNSFTRKTKPPLGHIVWYLWRSLLELVLPAGLQEPSSVFSWIEYLTSTSSCFVTNSLAVKRPS